MIQKYNLLESLQELIPGRLNKYEFFVKYSGRFSDFNANVKMLGSKVTFSLSRKWERIDQEIQLGLVQELTCKLFKVKIDTSKMRLYRIFVKNMHIIADKEEGDPLLVKSFERVNEKYFAGFLDQPNLKWGNGNYRTLGSYNFHNDTITVSNVFNPESDENLNVEVLDEFVDFIIYHELLHKKLQYDHNKRNAQHHTKEFRDKEEMFEDYKAMEKRMNLFLYRHKRKNGSNALFGVKKKKKVATKKPKKKGLLSFFN